MKCSVLVCVVALVAHGRIANATDRPLTDQVPIVAAAAIVVDAVPEILSVTAAVVPARIDPVAKRSPLLLAMYGAAGLLQAYDGYSTITGVAAGHVEVNPLMAPLVKHPGLVIAAEAVMTLATIAAAETLWRSHHRGQAIAMLIVSNGLMAAVGAHNAALLRGQR